MNKRKNEKFSKILKFLGNIKILKKFDKISREKKLFLFFCFLFFLVALRLFRLQVVNNTYYKDVLFDQHYTKSLIKAKRGNIYITDRSNKEMKLTDNIELYNIYVDPKFVKDKNKLIELVAPLIYEHFCVLNGLNMPTKEECINSIQDYTNIPIFTGDEKLEYQATGNKLVLDIDKAEEMRQQIIANFTTGDGVKYISQRMDELIKPGIRSRNYFGFFDSDQILNDLQTKNYPFVELTGNYVYLLADKSFDKKRDAETLRNFFKEHGYNYQLDDILLNLDIKEIRYIKIVNDVNSQIIQKLKALQSQYYSEKIDGIPLLHGVGLEKTQRRYYPYGTFLSHVLGFVDKNSDAYYGVEKYFDNELKGVDGDMAGLSVPWIGEIGSNDISISKAQDGNDLYLTIDPVIQKEAERIMKWYQADIRADSNAMLIMDPYSGKIISAVNYPTFDPNFYDDIYKIQPMKYADRELIDDDTYLDIPIIVEKDGKLKNATTDERKDESLKKYIFKNRLGPQTFVDKNISYPYEPGSVFKTITVAIGLDSDEISLYDTYSDPKNFIEVGEFTIGNVASQCMGMANTFLHALERSCNVGMTKIGLRMGQDVYYNYLERLGFGKKTGIELRGEEGGSYASDTSLARFFNNTFGQGILVTPIQLGMAYSAMVNGGYLVKPTIVDKIYDRKNDKFIDNEKKVLAKVFKTSTSEAIKESLYKVIYEGDLPQLIIPGYTVGGKTGTSQIAYKGVYRGGNGWTNSSFVGIVTKDDTKYVFVIQNRRPRKSQWGITTAGYIFNDMAKFLIEYEGIKR